MLTAKSRYTYGCNGPEDALFRATSNPTKKPADPSAVFTQYETGCPGDVQLLKNALYGVGIRGHDEPEQQHPDQSDSRRNHANTYSKFQAFCL